jgi:hypothetical protein
MACALELLNNASVGAFTGALLGAVGTYIVVRAVERAGKKDKAKSVLPALISTTRDSARHCLRSIESDRPSAKTLIVTLSPSFDTAAIDSIYREAFIYLSRRERLAIPNLIFWMKQVDAITANEQQAVTLWRAGGVVNGPTLAMYRQDRMFYLGVLSKLADASSRLLRVSGFIVPPVWG